MNPLLALALIAAGCVILCYAGANLPRWISVRRRRRLQERYGGYVDLTERRL